jgi:Tol biopolymer transport system component
MKNAAFKYRSYLILLLIPFVLNACAKESEKPLPDGIPNVDIVFMPDGDPLHAGYDDGETLGFINSDGSGEVHFTFKIFSGAKSNFGERLYSQKARYPRWSPSGTSLAFSVAGTRPDIRLIDSDGGMYGKKCNGLDQVSTFDSKGNILGELTAGSPDFQNFQNKIKDGNSLIASYDLKTCSLVKVISIPIPLNYLKGNISEVGNGLLIGEYYELVSYTNMIFEFDQNSLNLKTFPGYYPSLSKDGSLMAYFDKSGNLIVRNIESDNERTIITISKSDTDFDPDYVYLPGWSPDMKWLVYNTEEGEIYKVNIETGENIYLTDGWAPDWRP